MYNTHFDLQSFLGKTPLVYNTHWYLEFLVAKIHQNLTFGHVSTKNKNMYSLHYGLNKHFLKVFKANARTCSYINQNINSYEKNQNYKQVLMSIEYISIERKTDMDITTKAGVDETFRRVSKVI